MKTLDNIFLGLAWIAAALFVAAGAMLTYEVAARYFFVKPTIWAAELSQMALIWGSMVGMPWIMSARRHITVTAITANLAPKSRQWCELGALFVVIVFSLIVTQQGWIIFYDSFAVGRTTGSLMNMPIWIVELAIPFGFAMLSLQAVLQFIDVARHGSPEIDVVHE